MVRLAAWTLLSAVLLQAHCFYKAYDITSVLDLEQQGYKFYDVDGLTEGSLEKILVRHGMLARVRFVNDA
jgi:arabinogalactan endo-1,4-beta-galactosidase